MITDVLLGNTQAIKMYRGMNIVWERAGGGDEDVLPTGFKRCKCLTLSGNQYIKLTAVEISDPQFAFDVQITNAKPYGPHIVSSAVWSVILRGIGSFIKNYGTDTSLGFSAGNYRYKVAVNTDEFKGAAHVIEIDGTNEQEYITNVKMSGSSNPVDFTLFVYYSMPTNSSYTFIGKVYAIAILDAGEPVFDFIPALDQDGRPCMYDTVSQQPFYNNGTGEFGYER